MIMFHRFKYFIFISEKYAFDSLQKLLANNNICEKFQ